MEKPKLSTRQIWNMSVGFLGIQAGFALQNANASRILQNFGAHVEELPNFWLVAPALGMIVQPIIGYYSDHTWGKLGRRRPYFLGGAIVACLGLCLLPNANLLAFLPALYMGAGFLMLMDASFNVAMEPFRALVADKLPSDQATLGFSIQTCLIGIGAVIGSWLTYVLANWFGVAKTAAVGSVPPNVILSFYIGAVIFMAAILWTLFTTDEYPPEIQHQFLGDKESETTEKTGFSSIFSDMTAMPTRMKQLGLVQFFSWFGLFSMWVFMTPAIAQHVYGTQIDDSASAAYNDAGNWVGILFGIYNAVSAVYALLLPAVAKRFGRRNTHAFNLVMGGLGLVGIYFIHDKNWLILPMIGVGIAWASILAMPYAMLSGALPMRKIGIYMGIFNFFITIPQIISGIVNRPLVVHVFGNQAVYTVMMGGALFFVGAICCFFIEKKADE